MLRGYVGKLLWLSSNVRPDLSFAALDLSTSIKEPTMKALKKINGIVDRIQEQDNVVNYKYVGEREDICIEVLTDASYYAMKNSISGVIVLLAHKKNSRVSPLHWKARTIKRVCQSSKDAETRASEEGLDHAVMVSRILEKMFFGSVGKLKVEVRAQSDSEPLIRTLGSTKRTTSSAVIPNVRRLKEMLRLRQITRIKYIRSNKNLSDILTKFKCFNQEFSEIFWHERLVQEASAVEVRLVPRMTGDEIRIFKYGKEENEEAKDPSSIT